MPDQKQPTIRLEWTFHEIDATEECDFPRGGAHENSEELLIELLRARFSEALPGLGTAVLTSSCLEVCSSRPPRHPGARVISTTSFVCPNSWFREPDGLDGGLLLIKAAGSLKGSGTLRDHRVQHETVDLLRSHMLVDPTAIPLLFPSNLTIIVKVTLALVPAVTAGVAANIITGVFRKVRGRTPHDKVTERINRVVVRSDEVIVEQVERTYEKR